MSVVCLVTAGQPIFRNSLSRVVKLQSETFLSERPEVQKARCKTQRDMRGWRVSPRSLVYSGIWLNFTFHSAKLHEPCWKRNQINVGASVLFSPSLFIHLSFCYFILYISFSQALFFIQSFLSVIYSGMSVLSPTCSLSTGRDEFSTEVQRSPLWQHDRKKGCCGSGGGAGTGTL